MSTRARITAPLFIMLAAGIAAYVWYPQPQIPQTPVVEHNQALDKHTLQHLAIIMDGNRRWAKEQGMAAWRGHQKGTDPVKTAVEFCVEYKIPYLSLYAFSLENLKRSQDELDHLFKIIEDGLTNQEFEKLINNGVKVNIVGDPALFPDRLKKTFYDIKEKTKNGTALTLNIMFCYGGQQELTASMKQLGALIEAGKLKADAITPELIQRNLWTQDSPNPDLIIRTGGFKRLSNFMPWQSAYSELIFLDKYWPDMTTQDLLDALTDFTTIKRNFGT